MSNERKATKAPKGEAKERRTDALYEVTKEIMKAVMKDEYNSKAFHAYWKEEEKNILKKFDGLATKPRVKNAGSPKRAKSAYIIFGSMYRAEHKGEKGMDATFISQQWMSDKNKKMRKAAEKEADDEKAKYMEAKAKWDALSDAEKAKANKKAEAKAADEKGKKGKKGKKAAPKIRGSDKGESKESKSPKDKKEGKSPKGKEESKRHDPYSTQSFIPRRTVAKLSAEIKFDLINSGFISSLVLASGWIMAFTNFGLYKNPPFATTEVKEAI